MSDGVYWYARGYYDGRAEGAEASTDGLSELHSASYKAGYMRGVTDFCIIDNNEGEEE